MRKLVTTRIDYTIVAASAALGFLLWVVDAVLDSFFFFEKSFWDTLFTDLSLHEVYLRSVSIVFCFGFGLFISKLIARHRRAEEALQKSEEKHRSIVQSIEDGYYEVDLAGNFTYFNDALCRILGFSRDELLGVNNRQYADANTSKKVFQAFNTVYRAGVPQKEFDWPVIRRDGSNGFVDTSIHLIRDEAGNAVGFRGIVRDITERKSTEEALRRSEDQLRQAQKIEAIGRLAGGVAHDFNNMLMVMSGYTELLLSRLEADDPLRKHTEEIRKAADRAGSLTQQLLAFSRKQMLQPKVLDLNAVVADTEKMLRRLIDENVKLVTALSPGLGRVKADPGQIEQIILNLAVNARDAMPTGGTLTIETSNAELDETYACQKVVVTPGAYVLLAVSDTGAGMNAETQARIFEPFFTTKEQGKGTGLGLATIYGIVKQSDGYIWVYSEPGQGTTFKIYLPRVSEAVEKAGTQRSSAAPPSGSETVLVVEDEEGVRRLACEFLEKNGYTVLEAGDGTEAVRVAEEHRSPIDLVVTDVVMPQMSGRELVESLKSQRGQIRVLYMSGYTDDAIVQHGVLDQGTAFLQKPFSMDTLAHKVRQVLEQRKEQ